MRVTVFCEQTYSAEVDKTYPEGLGRAIANVFGKDTNLVVQEKGGDGKELFNYLEETDVLVWWGHCFHSTVSDELVDQVCKRVHSGMGLMVLHSGHFSKPFKRLMGTTGALRWREAGENERLWCINPSHPICEGLGEYVDIKQEETYGEAFDIPTPDELVFIGWFSGGEVFRAGCVFNRGAGKVFYFNPGHETFPTYKNAKIKKIMKNAAKYICPKKALKYPVCTNPPAPQK